MRRAKVVTKGTTKREAEDESVKHLEKIERNKGDSPKNARLKPEASPGLWGNILVAAKTDEKYEKIVPKPARRKKKMRRQKENALGWVRSEEAKTSSREVPEKEKKNNKPAMSEQA